MPDNETITYAYNQAGWLSSVEGYINDISYNARGQKTALTYANNITTNWQYFDQDVFGPINFRVKRRLTSGAQQDLNYTYDNVGNILSITDANFTANRTYLYDDLNRLISATGTFGPDQTQITQTFTYNAIGNLLDKGGTILSYNDPLHPSAVTSTSSGTSYSYDANGNMLTRGSQTLNWDVDNRVTSISVEGGGTTAMEYDYTGMRVRKDAPTGIMLFPFDGYEIDPNGIISKFIRIGRETFASKRGADKYFYHNDHLGGVNVITDINGAEVQRNEYDPWGSVSKSVGSIDPTHRFTGKELDPETGLYYYGGRYYDAEIGRFISPDPFIQAPDNPQNLNRYSYVLNNPVNYIDPSGYFFKKLFKKLWNFTKKAWKGILHSTIGRIFISAVVGFATGFVLGPAGLGWLSSAWAIGAASGAAAGATMAGLSGGNPLLGALSGGAFGFVAGGGLNFGGPILPIVAGSGGLSTPALIQISGGAAQVAMYARGGGWHTEVEEAPVQLACGPPCIWAYQAAQRAAPYAQRAAAQVERAIRAIGTKLGHLKEHLTREDLTAALSELQGKPLTNPVTGKIYDHVAEVQGAQRGLLNQIDRLNRLLSNPHLSEAHRAEVQRMLGETSRLLDHTEQFVPR